MDADKAQAAYERRRAVAGEVKHTATPKFKAQGNDVLLLNADGKEGSVLKVASCDFPGDADFIARACGAHDDLAEFFNASMALQIACGHPDATAEDERKAEERYKVATSAARAALAKAAI